MIDASSFINSDSLFAKYFWEREGKKTFLSEDGFFVYRMAEGDVLFLAELFVPEEKRGTPSLLRLISEAERIARAGNCNRLTGMISPAAAGADRCLAAAFKVGFRLHSAQAGSILIVKDLEG